MPNPAMKKGSRTCSNMMYHFCGPPLLPSSVPPPPAIPPARAMPASPVRFRWSPLSFILLVVIKLFILRALVWFDLLFTSSPLVNLRRCILCININKLSYYANNVSTCRKKVNALIKETKWRGTEAFNKFTVYVYIFSYIYLTYFWQERGSIRVFSTSSTWSAYINFVFKN